jgi:hypothetical protein
MRNPHMKSILIALAVLSFAGAAQVTSCVTVLMERWTSPVQWQLAELRAALDRCAAANEAMVIHFETFRADYPAMVQLRNQIKEIDRQIGILCFPKKLNSLTSRNCARKISALGKRVLGRRVSGGG